jgi:hypothetical protein
LLVPKTVNTGALNGGGTADQTQPNQISAFIMPRDELLLSPSGRMLLLVGCLLLPRSWC